jgi:CheY-like chemotaxis protein
MKTILVVDDEFDMTGTLRAILEGEGYRVETCADGREALDRVSVARPDLIIMDVMMPVLSGFEVLLAMRRTSGLETIPVILMSSVMLGVKRDEYRWQAYLRKPFRLDDLTGAGGAAHRIGTRSGSR